MELYDKMSVEYNISAREYFVPLRLAIYWKDKEYLKGAAEIVCHHKSKAVLDTACELLKVLYGGRR